MTYTIAKEFRPFEDKVIIDRLSEMGIKILGRFKEDDRYTVVLMPDGLFALYNLNSRFLCEAKYECEEIMPGVFELGICVTNQKPDVQYIIEKDGRIRKMDYENQRITTVTSMQTVKSEILDDFVGRLAREYAPCRKTDKEVYESVIKRITDIAAEMKDEDIDLELE